MNKSLKCFLFSASIALLAGLASTPAANAQEQDPTQESDVIKETMAKILEVEKLDSYIQANAQLKSENATLKKQLADLAKQVSALSTQLTQQREQLQRQLLQVPTFEIKSKIISGGRGTAVLQSGNRLYRVRSDTQISIPVKDGVWVLMKVEKISKDLIQLSFPEMSRTVYLYD